MNLEDARGLVGSDLLWLVPGTGKMLVGVTVRDTRVAYGRTQVLIEPLSGRGSRWADAELLQPVED
ncbi:MULTISPECIES: hypothetical protein [Protofrankia]|uniref:Uncharacterized protein n=1 Tax=Protofrankia coriariae TaxID=1562887 RepID=A0ABR5F313_9ACTN|nr:MULTISPECIES: hypothetical protein [Protofrankia]KLL11111.1 hypothetical protein FrCorBMG51_13360 [Protofrankia coriariae]ONH34805.1 hypothetical protein BL254_14450 [Protofrankia sp. BMG5.30]